MKSTTRSGRVLVRVLILIIVCSVLAGGAYVGHKYRRRSLARKALITGQAAYAAREYTKAATDLGKYLSVHRGNVEVLLAYADSQIRRRPQSKGSYQQAINALEIILRDDPAHRVAAERLCDFYLAAEARIDAERIARAWLTAAQKPEDGAAARGRLVKALLAQQKLDEASQIVRAWLAESADDPAARQLQADVCVARRQPAEAITVLRSVVEQRPGDIHSDTRLAVLLLTAPADASATRPEAVNDAEAARQQRRAEAEEVLNNLVARNPDSAEARLARGRFYYQILLSRFEPMPDDREKALEDLDAAITLAADQAETPLEAGLLLAQMGLIEKADAAFDRAEAAAPGNPVVYAVRGQAALDTGRTEAGVAIAEAAMKAPLGEARFDILPLVAELYAVGGRPADARKCIDDLRAANLPPEVLLYLEALAQIAEGKTLDAVDNLQEVNRRAPSYARAYLILARTLQRSGYLRRAVEPLREYARLESDAGRPMAASAARIEIARLLASLGRWEEVVTAAAEIEPFAPNPSLANAAFLTRMELTGRAARMKPGGPAPDTVADQQRQVERLIEANPEAVILRILLARLIAWQGNVDEAVRMLEAERNEGADAKAITEALIDLYTEADRFDQAVIECKRAVELADEAERAALTARLADLQAAAGDTDSAVQLLDQQIAAASGRQRTAARAQLARLLLGQDKADQARALLVQAALEDPSSVEPRLLLLQIGPAADQTPARQELVDQLKSIEGPAGLNWRFWQAVVWLEGDDWSSHGTDIEGLLNECLRQDPAWEAAGLALASLHEKTGDIRGAMEACRRVFDRDRSNRAAALRLLDLAQRTQRWDDEVNRVLNALPPDDPVAQSVRLAQALRRGDEEQATTLLEKRVAANPNDFMARLQLSSVKLRADEVTEAERRLEEAMRIAPDAPEVLAARVQLHLRKSEFEQALLVCDGALAKEPTADLHQLRSRVHEAKGDLARAAADLQAIADVSGDGMVERGFLALGRLWFRHDELDQAVRSWREGLERVPTSYPLRGAVAGVLLGSEDEARRRDGARILDEMLAERPDDQTLLLMRAEHIARARPDEAQAAFEEIIRKHPTSFAAYLGMARIAAARGDRDQALQLVDRGLIASPQGIERFNLLMLKAALLIERSPDRSAVAAQQALEIRPDSEEAVVALSSALSGAGSRNQAIEVLGQFLQRPEAGQSVMARLALAELRIAQEDYAAADALILESARSAPENPGVVQARLVWHRAQSQWDMLTALATDHLQKHPDDAVTPRAAAQLLLGSPEPKHREAALRLLQRVIELHPEDAVNRFNLGAAFYALERFAEARDAYEQGLKLAPSRADMLNDLTWIVCEDLKDPRAAEPWGQKAKAAQPKDPHVLDTWGVLMYRLGRLEESQEALRKCLDLPATPRQTRRSAVFHLARTLAAADNAEARQESRQLLDELFRDPDLETTFSPAALDEARALLKALSSATNTASQPAGPVTDGPGALRQFTDQVPAVDTEG